MRAAADGTFLKANDADSIHTKASLGKGLKRLDEKIAEYHRQMDEAMRDRRMERTAGTIRNFPIEALVERRKHKQSLQERLQASGENQISEVGCAGVEEVRYRCAQWAATTARSQWTTGTS